MNVGMYVRMDGQIQIHRTLAKCGSNNVFRKIEVFHFQRKQKQVTKARDNSFILDVYLNSKFLFFYFKVFILLDDWGLLGIFLVSNFQLQFISYVLVETYHDYINRVLTKFWFTQCHTMIHLDFLNFLGSNSFWSSCYIFLFCLPIYNCNNAVILCVVAVFDPWKNFDYYYYLRKVCKNTVMYQKLLVAVILLW